jgi:hypothetical protein
MKLRAIALFFFTCGLLTLCGCGLAPAGAAAGLVLLLISLGLAGCYRSTDSSDQYEIPDADPPDGESPDAGLPDAGLPDAGPPECGTGICPDQMTCVISQDNGPWCFPDADEDGLWDEEDNCPYLFNQEQQDADGDGFGDDCDLCDQDPNGPTCAEGEVCCHDPDGDGVPGRDVWPFLNQDRDNCPYIYNPDQADTDGDGWGDACDLCPEEFNPLSPCGDPCLDSDGDGVPDLDYCVTGRVDACPLTPSDNRNDTDGDGVDDVCDPDGVPPLQDGEGVYEARAGGLSPDGREEMRRRIVARLRTEGIIDEETAMAALSPKDGVIPTKMFDQNEA